MSTSTNAQNLEPQAKRAADQLISVTGDKSVQGLWDLADEIYKADPKLSGSTLLGIRQAAIDKAGHEKFWKVNRLRQLGNTAKEWRKSDRIDGVSLDAHMEAHRKLGDIAEARKVILKIQKDNGGDPENVSIRKVRRELGANGTGATPPRVDKADAEELFKRLSGKREDLHELLRRQMKRHEKDIRSFAKLFGDLVKNLDALDAPKPAKKAPAKKTTASQSSGSQSSGSQSSKPETKKKGRVVGL